MLEGANQPKNAVRQAIIAAYHSDETACVEQLLSSIQDLSAQSSAIEQIARELVINVREEEAKKSGIELFMQHYDLSTEEGIMLMCLAEALLRIPDKETENLLIRDKLTSADWTRHVGQGESAFVNMATWGLALTGKVLNKGGDGKRFQQLWKGFVRRSSEPVVRRAVREAIKIMSEQFVLGRTIEEALKLSKPHLDRGYAFSYDMLGEAARTLPDAEAYFNAYYQSITAIGKTAASDKTLFQRPSISVKLSALYPRYEFNYQTKAVPYLVKQLTALSLEAKRVGIALTVDAEEADRLDLSLDIFEQVFADPALGDWEGLGLAVQAYQKRAPFVLQWAADLARRCKKHIRVRLVKGAYWDSEIKHAQEMGYPGFPVFTRKVSTDVSYLACAKLLLTEMQDAVYPQFATHNAFTVAALLKLLGDKPEAYQFEFQSLHGMGDALHDQLIARGIQCRVYAPVGSHEDLLPYLVRRLLENGANSSFVNQIADKDVPIAQLIQSPIAALQALEIIPNTKIPLPEAIFGQRQNSQGLDVTDYHAFEPVRESMRKFETRRYQALPMARKKVTTDELVTVQNPANHADAVGTIVMASEADVEEALSESVSAFAQWNAKPVSERAAILRKAADLLEAHRDELMTLTQREAGKVLSDAIAEIREAVDFCRYYADEAEALLVPTNLQGYTGETNTLTLKGCGPFLCISPWNFPIAIFTGQVMAALVAGNTVIAKPAGQTTLIAAKVVALFHEAGIPKSVLQLVCGSGGTVGDALVKDERIVGIIFTGSTATAKHIQMRLAERKGPIIPFIAETGGINAMIADSSALPEQLIDDVVLSAFGSAGQRCSALRVLYIQDDVADKVITMLKGAMATLVVGNPNALITDVGPVIDAKAKQSLEKHIDEMLKVGQLIHRCEAPDLASGTYVLPHAIELPDLSAVQREAFGPILHVIRFKKAELDRVIDDINGLNYGLTFGIQSRINETVDYIASRINAGNIYVNRNMTGAIVGLQPFGGNRYSGTGPKAGGPHYLLRLCSEQTLTINTTAAGGNASLMAMD